jgi:lysozyme
MDFLLLQKQLVGFEGLARKPYTDTEGKLTIGIGHNLTDKGLTERQIYSIFGDDVDEVRAGLNRDVSWWMQLSEPRQRVLADMAFNMGTSGLLGFPKMLAAAQRGDFQTAAAEMRNSLWARQVGHRAEVLAGMMERG